MHTRQALHPQDSHVSIIPGLGLGLGLGWGNKWPEWPEQQLVDLCCRGTHGNFGQSLDIYVSMLFTTTEIRQLTRPRTTNSCKTCFEVEFRACTPQHSSPTHPHQSSSPTHPHQSHGHAPARTDGFVTTTRRGNHIQSDLRPNSFKCLPTCSLYVPNPHPRFPPVPICQIRDCRDYIEKVGHIHTRVWTLIRACTHTLVHARSQIHFSTHLEDLFETTKRQPYTCAGADTHAGEHNTQKLARTPQSRSSTN